MVLLGYRYLLRRERISGCSLSSFCYSGRFDLERRPYSILPARRCARTGTNHGLVSVCLCLSQLGVLSKRLNKSSWFCHGSFLPPILHCANRKFGYLQKDTSLWNFVPNSGLRKFCFGISIVKTCYQLSSRNVDAQGVINWTIVGHLSLYQRVSRFPYFGYLLTQEAQLSPSDRAMRLVSSNLASLPITTQQCRNYLYDRS